MQMGLKRIVLVWCGFSSLEELHFFHIEKFWIVLCPPAPDKVSAKIPGTNGEMIGFNKQTNKLQKIRSGLSRDKEMAKPWVEKCSNFKDDVVQQLCFESSER